MNRGRTQRRRQSRKATRRVSRKQYGGGGVCTSDTCEYKDKRNGWYHSWGNPVTSKVLYDKDSDSYYRRETYYCNKCNCHQSSTYTVWPDFYNKHGNPKFISQ